PEIAASNGCGGLPELAGDEVRQEYRRELDKKLRHRDGLVGAAVFRRPERARSQGTQLSGDSVTSRAVAASLHSITVGGIEFVTPAFTISNPRAMTTLLTKNTSPAELTIRARKPNTSIRPHNKAVIRL